VKRIAVALLPLLLATACSGGGQQRVIVAAGTTLVDSGFLNAVADRFEESHPEVQLSIVGEASARILDLGRRGGADVLITHAPDLEAEFVHDGLAARYETVLTSSFVLVGPADSVPEGPAMTVLAEIVASNRLFVSRGDGSGTHQTELWLWEQAGVDPVGESWYLETGQGMGLTLQVADQRDAFTLSELGAFLAASHTLTIEPVDASGIPRNPYHLTVVLDSPERRAGEEFLDWLIGPEGVKVVDEVNHELFGRPVYESAAG
jgi:tungstate transport system substrate-binding protein